METAQHIKNLTEMLSLQKKQSSIVFACVVAFYNLQGLVIEDRKKAAHVDAYQPVRFFAAECRFVERIKFMAVPQFLHPLADGVFFKGRDPEPFALN